MLARTLTDQCETLSLQSFGRNVRLLFLTNKNGATKRHKGLPVASTAPLQEAVTPKGLSEELREDFIYLPSDGKISICTDPANFPNCCTDCRAHGEDINKLYKMVK